MYPLKFKPILKTVVWGGEKIAPYKEVVTDQHNIGESWELSGVKGHESVIANGEFEGKTITELVEQFKGKLVGEKVYANTGNEFPLLIKFIDAKSDLSIQVHPNDELAAKRHNSKGKTNRDVVCRWSRQGRASSFRSFKADYTGRICRENREQHNYGCAY